jgi:hypothetical protein
MEEVVKNVPGISVVLAALWSLDKAVACFNVTG